MNSPESVPSPCISVCRMSEKTGLCEGCRRSLEEIARWANTDDADRRAILARIEQRKKQESA